MKTPAEYQRDYRDRLKSKARREERQLAPLAYQPPFFEWLEENRGRSWDDGDFHKDASQITIPEFTDDSGPYSVDGEIEQVGKDDPENDPYAGYPGSLGRAERLIDDLLALASIYASTISTYKKEQLEARIKEIEDTNLSDPNTKKKALADILRFRKMLEHLDKARRISIQEYKIKGI